LIDGENKKKCNGPKTKSPKFGAKRECTTILVTSNRQTKELKKKKT